MRSMTEGVNQQLNNHYSNSENPPTVTTYVTDKNVGNITHQRNPTTVTTYVKAPPPGELSA